MSNSPVKIHLEEATLKSLQEQLNELAEGQERLGNAIDEIKKLITELKQ